MKFIHLCKLYCIPIPRNNFTKTEMESLILCPCLDASFLLLLLRVSIAEVGGSVRGVRPGMINDARNSFLPSRTRRESPFWQCLVYPAADINYIMYRVRQRNASQEKEGN